MSTSTLAKAHADPKATNDDTLVDCWYQSWLETTNSIFKLQRIWLETANEAFRHELELIATVAPLHSRLTQCMLGFDGPPTPTSMVSCYQKIAGDMSEATYNRIRQVSELSDDFRERIWSAL